MEPENLRLEIDGEDVTSECERVDFRLPRLVYEDGDEHDWRKFLGPQGFQITLINPSDRLRSLADGGVTVHEVRITVDGCSLTNPVHFLKEWDANGVRRVFGRLPVDPRTVAMWVPEGDRQDPLADLMRKG